MNQPRENAQTRQTADGPEPQHCCSCGRLTDTPVRVGEVHTASGAGSTIWACPDHAAGFPPLRMELP